MVEKSNGEDNVGIVHIDLHS